MESEKQLNKLEASNFKTNKEGAGAYRVIGLRQEQAPGSFTGFGLYYPVLKGEGFTGKVINEGRGFDPGLSFRNIPTQLLLEHGIDATREDEVDQIVDMLNKKSKEIILNKDDIVARYSKDFVKSLQNIGAKELKFDYVTSVGNESLKIMTEEAYKKLGEKYNKRARKILLNQLSETRFGETTEQMRDAANVIAGNRPQLERKNMTLYNLYALHALDFDNAVRYLSINNLFLGETTEGVKKTLVTAYIEIKNSAISEEERDDVERFRFFLETIEIELEERERLIAEKIKNMRNTDNLTTN